MSAGEVEQEVFLDVHGEQIKAAFDAIDARIKGIQAHIETISQRAASAGAAFGGGLQQSLQRFNKISGQLDTFQRNVLKDSPAVQSDAAWQTRKKQLDDEARLARKISDEKEAAYARIARQDAVRQEKLARQQQSDEARLARERLTNEQKLARLDEQRFATARASEMRLEREREAAIRKENQLREQNQLKIARDNMQQQVGGLRGVSALQTARYSSTQQLSALRSAVGGTINGAPIGAADERRLLHAIELEKERIRLIDQRIAKEQAAATRYDASDARINRGLDVRSAKADEKEIARTIENVGVARARQAEIEGRIVANIERARLLTGQEKIAAENLLRVDEARLAVISARSRQLEAEAAKQAKLAAAPPGGKGGGLFGNSGIGGVIARTAAYGGAAMAIYSTIGAIRDGITAAIQFEDSLAKIGAVAGLTATQQSKLGESIRAVAANSRFATNEIADATMVLAQAGFSASDIGNSLQQVANLATAAGVSMQEATDVVTSAIGAFQLQTSETGHIADVLSAALNTTKLNIQQVALGIQYAGQTAYENKISFDELTASMATMAQAGIKSGSTIGTGLRMFLVDLMTPTKKLAKEFETLGISMSDIDVKTLGLPEVLKRLSDHGYSAANAYASLEKRSAAAYIVLKNNQDLLTKQIEIQNQLGNSAEAAAKGADSFAAEWQKFKNQVNEKMAADTAGPLHFFKELLHTFNEVNSNGEIRKMEMDLRKVQDMDVFIQKAEEIRKFKEALKENAQILMQNSEEMERAATMVNEATDAFNQQEQAVKTESDAIGRLVQRHASLKENSAALSAETASLMNRFEGLAQQLYGTTQGYEQLLGAMRAVRAESISLGALKAGEQAMGYDEEVRAGISGANRLGQHIVASGAYGQLPKNIHHGIQQIRRNPTPTDSAGQRNLSVLTKMVYDYASSGRGNPGDMKFLRDWAVQSSKNGLNAAAGAESRTTQQMYQSLGSTNGQKYLAEIDALTGQSDKAIQAKAQWFAAQANAKGNSPGERKAFMSLYEMAIGKMGSGVEPQAPEGKTKKAKANHLPERQDRAMDALSLKADAAELANAIKGLLDKGGSVGPDGLTIIGHRTLTKEQLDKNLSRVQDALDAWVDDRTKQVEDEMKRLKIAPGSEKGKAMLADLQREIDAKREETSRQVGERISKALDMMVDSVEKVAQAAEEAADHQLNLSQSRLTALQRYQNNGGQVPDYVQQTLERQHALASDNRDQMQISINENKLAGLRNAYSQIAAVADAAQAKSLLENIDPALKSLDDLSLKIVALSNNTEELRASFATPVIPQNFSEQLQMAAQNYMQVNHLTASFGEMIGMNLTDAIGTAHGALTQFLDDAMNGTGGVMGAWRNMTQTLIKYLQQLLIKMIAVKIMQMVLGSFGGGMSSPGLGGADVNLGSVSPVASMPSTIGDFKWLYGGEVKALSGRYIRHGVPNRDSVRARIARGEYVVRKSAVDSVGVDFMNQLNERGSSALKAFAPKVVMPPPANQNMNVYVVAPEHQPSMGPNDVLVTIAEDIYRGGPTKQLIKQVSQGG